MATDDVRRAQRMLLEVGVPVSPGSWKHLAAKDAGRRYHPFGGGGARRLATNYGVPFLAELPLDRSLAAVGEPGQRAPLRLAAALWGWLEASPVDSAPCPTAGRILPTRSQTLWHWTR